MGKIINKIKEKNILKAVLIYTPLFVMLAFFMIYIFAKNNKSFIWQSDGLQQHIITLKYFRTLLIHFIKTGSISIFTWSIGNGLDLFANLAYYILGDIFSYIAIIFKTSQIETLYNVLIIIRMYFIGITFICYCRYKKMNLLSSIIGALMYTFSSFVLFSAVRHPYFINSIILFPLIMIGIEKIILKDEPFFYTIIIAITFLSSFYFAYMLSLIIAIYGVILAIYTYKYEGVKKILKVLLKTLLYSILGIAISAVVLLPTVIQFLQSERSSSGIIYPYSLNYYRNFINEILTVDCYGYWKIAGVQSIILISLPIFVRKRKENYPLFWLLMFLQLPLLFSKIGSVFAGFSFPNNRWTFVISFIFSFITTLFINNDSKINKKDLLWIISFIELFFVINIIFEVNLNFYKKIQIIILVGLLLIMLNKEKLKTKFSKINLYAILLIFIICFGITVAIKGLYDIEGNNLVSQFIDSGTSEYNQLTSIGKIDDFYNIVEYLNKNDNNFYRISKYPYNYDNVPLIMNYNSTNSYYSITSNNLKMLSNDLNNIQYFISKPLKEFDYRTKITTLLGDKYYIKNGKNTIPYGYSLIEDYNGDSKIYKNNYALPFGVLYNNYITLDEYNKLNSLEKESSLLKTTALMDKDINNSNLMHSKKYNYNNIIKEVDYSIIDENNILTDNNITIESNKYNTIELKIGEVKNSEIYIYLEGLKYTPYSKKEQIALNTRKKATKNEIEKVNKQYKWYQPNYSYKITAKFNEVSKSRNFDDITSAYYEKTPELLFNLGYYENVSGKQNIILELSKTGHYSFDNIKVYAVSMDEYKQDINNLRKSNFEVETYNNGYLKGKVNAEEDGILQFSTFYNKGWKVFVDGKRVDTLLSNKYFLGIMIGSGEHTIYMKYNTPYIKEGLIITITGIGIFAILCIKDKKQKSIK